MSLRPTTEPLSAFLGALARFSPRRTALACTLLVLQGLTEGIGLVLLVPFLLLVGDQGAAEPTTGVARFVGRAFGSIGLPLSLHAVLLVFVALVALRSVLLARAGILLVQIQLGFVNRLRARIFGAIGHAGWRTLLRRRLSDVVHAMAQDVNRVSVGTREALDLLATGVLVLAYGLAAVRISAGTTAIAVAIGLVLEGVRWPLVRQARRLGEATTTIQREAFSVVTEFIGGLKPIKARGLEDRHHAMYVDANERIEARRLAYARASLRSHVVHQVLLALALAALIYVSATRLGVNTAELLVVVFIFARLLPLLSKAHQGYTNMVEALPAYESALASCAELEGAAEASGGEPVPLSLERELALEGVTIRYEEGREALDCVGLVLPKHRTLAVIGPSGSGKTTLVDVIMGLLLPDEGRVTVDGQQLSGPRLAAWRRAVAYVPQETFLLHDTIEANLRWMAPDATEDELWDALRRAAAEDFVRQLPDGWKTLVGDRGARLSGGERQRIALARALATHPELLILDEATSQLDAANERQILGALDALHGEMAVVIIAHRPILLEHADDVLMLEEGRVVEAGPREELARSGRLAAWQALLGSSEGSRESG